MLRICHTFSRHRLQLAQHVDALVWQSERPVETALSSSNIELLQRRLDIWAQLARQGRS